MRTVEFLVIGAGPAGLQLGYFLDRAGRDYLVLEGGAAAGTFFQTFPRHRTLISINKRHTGWTDPELNLRMDWNSLLSDDPELLFTRYTRKYFPDADMLVRYLADFAERTGVRVQYDTRVVRVARAGELFTVTDQRGDQYQAKVLVMATGVSQPYLPDVPGIETAEPYQTVTTDPDDFLDQRVLILGKGNSAFETADNLVETAAVLHLAGPHSIRMAWRTHFVGHLRAVNNNFLDTYQLKSQNAVLDGDVVRIEKNDSGYLVTFRFTRAAEVIKDIRYDRVIACTGFRFDADMFDPDCRPELTIKDRFPAQTSGWRSTNIPDLYFAGTITQMRDFKKSTSGFIHGFRYGVRALHHVLERRYHDVPWPGRPVATEPAAFTQAVLERVNRTSALWQLFGVLGDVLVVRPDGASYHDEVPVAYVKDSDDDFARAAPDHFVVTLEYGPNHDAIDPFDMTVGRIAQNEMVNAHEGRYLHPVVRHYRGTTLVAEHHITENLENDWTWPAHHEALSGFFARQLNLATAAHR